MKFEPGFEFEIFTKYLRRGGVTYKVDIEQHFHKSEKNHNKS